MIKRVSIYMLPEGTDPDEFWKFHTEVHAADWAKIAGPALKKYVVNRVTEVVGGEPRFWGLVEQWWESEEACEECGRHARDTLAASGLSVAEDFASRVTGTFRCRVEEKDIRLE